MLQKFKEFFRRKDKTILEKVREESMIQVRNDEPTPEKDYFKGLVKNFVVSKKHKIKHRKRGERHGLSLREARKMGVAE